MIYFCFCSSVPSSKRVGTSISIPCPPIPEGTLALENSVAIILDFIMSGSPPYPPYSFGTDLAKYPLSINNFCQLALVISGPFFPFPSDARGDWELSTNLRSLYSLQKD